MYKSPVELITKQMNTQIEDYVFKAIQEVAVNIDKEELIRALQYDRDQYDKGYRDGKQAKKWISVEDGLPEENIRVLVWIDKTLYDYTHIDTDRLKSNTWVRWGKAVTHWMPLPTPPIEKE